MYFIIGAIFGSFFCVLSERWPIRKNFWSERSCCPHCDRELSFYELVPLLSFLFLRGKCRTCHSRIPRLYFCAEIIYGGIIWGCYTLSPWPGSPSRAALLVWLTMAFLLSLTDCFYLIIDSWMLVGFSIMLWVLLWKSHVEFHWITALVCLLFYLLFQHSSYIGEGDLLLFISWFSWLDFSQIHFLLLIASLSGIIYYSLAKWIGKKEIIQLPFVPFLSIGLFFTFLFSH